MHIFLKVKLYSCMTENHSYKSQCLTTAEWQDLKSFSSHTRLIKEPCTFMNYVYCVFMCIYVYVCQRVCCIDSSGFNSIFQFKCALLA